MHLIRRIPFNYLLVNLAAADISYATFAVPNIILSHHVYHPEGLAGTLLCTTLTGGNLSWVGGRASMITLLVIAIERYFAVVHPHGNKGKLTNRKLKVCDIQVYRSYFSRERQRGSRDLTFPTFAVCRLPAAVSMRGEYFSRLEKTRKLEYLQRNCTDYFFILVYFGS